ncbi:GNAT family N-acetyltransferase [Actinoplanes sp. NEAU-A12]|uniref:GNAT family N-acetyltransferase n=1 Tax=Actinoplanes sandaracinus TaxID=3045177 RepID=A0ABT6WUW7_9ACTN|nr:GNAT family N-acetyltransferase [Actinoplanes sandaracinus]MDI6103538.1 GNAT family N-acetyltransferase [Actinoplanes sandaracinus]
MIEIDYRRDPLVRWALPAPGARVWRRPDAVVVACPDLSHWDRLVMNGEPAAVAKLLREVLAETGETFRPFGTEELVNEVVARVPELEVSATFAWMETTQPVRRCGSAERGQRGGPAGAVRRGATTGPTPVWLGEDEWPEVTEMMREAYPESYAWPGAAGVHRWAGIRGDGGELLTVAAEAWSTREIGFMSGVATRPSARGRGLGAAICAFAADELLAGRERVALLVDYWNTAALATYTRLGFTTRRVAAARRR